MGRKRAWRRQHFFLYLACLLTAAFIAAACIHLPVARQANQHLEKARRFIVQEDFDAAIMEAEEGLKSSPQSIGDEALYLMGVIYAHPKNPDSNWQRSMENFKLLIGKYPKSSRIQESEVWISMLGKIQHMNREIFQLKETITKNQSEIESLRTQIDNLKKIDLGIEEKKRRNLPQ